MTNGPVGFVVEYSIDVVQSMCMFFMIEADMVVAAHGRRLTRIEMTVFDGNLAFDANYLGASSAEINAQLAQMAEKYNVALRGAQGFISMN